MGSNELKFTLQNTSLPTEIGSISHEIESSPGPLQHEDRLIFMHFAKTAGTTVHNCLSNLFTESEICPERLDNIVLWPASITQNYRYFSCHAPLSNFRFIPKPVKIITFLRHPVERAVSIFEYWASHTDEIIAQLNLAGPRLAKALGIKKFFSPENIGQCGRFWQNYAPWLAGDGYLSPSGQRWRSEEEIVQIATENLDSLAFVGFTEDLETSFERLSLQLDIPNFYRGQSDNVSRTNYLNNPQHFEPVQDFEIDNNLIDDIKNCVSIDQNIYDYAIKNILGRDSINRPVRCLPGDANICRTRISRVGKWVQNFGGGYVLFGPYIRLVPSKYKIEFQIQKLLNFVPYDDDELGFVDVVGKKGTIIFGKKFIQQHNFLQQSATIEVLFTMNDFLSDLEFRVYLKPGVPLEVNTMVIVSTF